MTTKIEEGKLERWKRWEFHTLKVTGEFGF
jgi:hypothetical protein